MESSIRDHFMATLAHLDVRRAQLTSELHKVEEIIRGLRVELDGLGKSAELPFQEHDGLYKGMSVRWAIIMFLAEHSGGTGTLSMIADALRTGGLSTKGVSFNSNVSAVLSQMISKGEIVKTSDRFTLSPAGFETWRSIQTSPRFKALHLDPSSPEENTHVQA